MNGESMNFSNLSKIFDKNKNIQKLFSKDSNKKTPSDIMNIRMIQLCRNLPEFD